MGIGKVPDGRDHIVHICQRLAHPHKNNVTRLVGDSLDRELLTNYLASSQISLQASERRGTKQAAHRAADLTGQAKGTVGVHSDAYALHLSLIWIL